jgi:hypothetical protein
MACIDPGDSRAAAPRHDCQQDFQRSRSIVASGEHWSGSIGRHDEGKLGPLARSLVLIRNDSIACMEA